MLFFFTSRIISSIVAFLYPGYASYKTLSQRPASEEELERWLMYWSVLGCIVGVEYIAEWLVSWVPFYYPIKTLFLLYLALPQTRGSSYLYIYHLQPFFHNHESQIDAALASFKARIYTFLQERIRALWEQVSSTVGQQQQANFNPVGGVTDANAGAPPTLGDPVSGPAQIISSIWQSYGPSIVASGAALILRQSQRSANARARTRNGGLNSPPASPPSAARVNSTQSVLERRRQLEAELASLPSSADNDAAAAFVPPPLPIPPASASFNPSRTSSESDLRERSGSGRFEEIEAASDVEGYDVGGFDREDEHAGASTGEGRPPTARRTSWFGWGGAVSARATYERVKSD